jgi:hypothetical protein
MHRIHLFILLLASQIVIFTSCQLEAPSEKVDLEPIKSLVLLDRYVVEPYMNNIEEILKQRDSIFISKIGINAYAIHWGGEVGGPRNSVLYFFRPSPNHFQGEFLYTGEYEMSRMMSFIKMPLDEHKEHYLGKQLTRLGFMLGDEVCLNRENMKELMIRVMEDLLHCPIIRKGFMDSLDLKNPPLYGYLDFDLKNSDKKELIKAVQQVKNEMCVNPDPYVVFFHGELINGIWKGTVRQYDHTGRFCIDLEYLNGRYAYTIWL